MPINSSWRSSKFCQNISSFLYTRENRIQFNSTFRRQ